MIGSDFERFLELNGKVCSVEPLGLPGKFAPPVEVFDAEGLAGHVHRDNVMLELCVPPQKDALSFSVAVSRVTRAAAEWLSKTAPGMTIGPRSGAVFSAADLKTPEAAELGCDIDFLVGSNTSAPRTALYAELLGRNRFAGGHLHFSWPDKGRPAWVGAMICDLLIGLREFPNLNPMRAEFYGTASLHRPTKYPDGAQGVEYRPLDCYWTTSPQHLNRVSRLAEATHKVLNEGTMTLLQKMVELWRSINTAAVPLVNLGGTKAAAAAVEDATRLFHKEFGYDPV